MKQFIYLFSGLLLLFASTPRVVAQEIGDYSQLNDEDYSKIDLPPLSVLFENAKNNPIYELADAKTAIERKLLQKEKWAFLGFFSLRGSYQYGMFGNESTYTDVAIAPYLTYLLFSYASRACDCLSLSVDRSADSMVPLAKFFSDISYCTLARIRLSLFI